MKQWHNLYFTTWAGILPEGGYHHPAKFAPGLIKRIYAYLYYELEVPKGATVLDPFGGVATGALYAMLSGYNWYGQEIEKHFWIDGRQNIAIWQRDYRPHYPQMGNAVLANKDSAKAINGKGEVLISSPPFSTGETRDRTTYQDGDIARMMNRAYTVDNQSTDERNLAALKDNEEDFAALISSPPYEDMIKSGEGPGARWDNVHHSEGNKHKISSRPDYGQHTNQLGNTAGDAFWPTAKRIVDNCYAALSPGSYAIWVTKNYVRKGELVDFTDRWRRLCETSGFVLHEHIAAMTIQDDGVQLDIFGNEIPQIKERKSMFRRLAERRGSPRIDHEDVLVLRKPL